MTRTSWPSFIAALQPQLSESATRAEAPSGAPVETPDPDVPEPLRAWSGHWTGWAGLGRAVDVRLIVERVTGDGAEIRYVEAGGPRGSIERRLRCRSAGDELVADTGSGARVAFRLRGADTAEFLWRDDGGGWMCGVVARADAGARWSAERVSLPVTSDEPSATLETIVFRPASGGPFPTLLFNHGSTGAGTDPSLFRLTWTCLPLARFFTERGWLVAFPQRRGRGKSDGEYAEGMKPSGNGYSTRAAVALAGVDRALEDLDACVAWLATRAEVDAGRTIVGGHSRGGALAIATAGRHPDAFRGAINFAGGWLGDGAASAARVNAATFERGASFGGPSLWLYADDDGYYSSAHSREGFDRFERAGGGGTFRIVSTPPGTDGHQLVFAPATWCEHVDAFLADLPELA